MRTRAHLLACSQYRGVCGNPDLDPLGDWCFIDPEVPCAGTPAATYFEQDHWDYCHTSTRAGCLCANAWTAANGEVFHGTCGNPDDDPQGEWCLVVNGSCQGQAPQQDATWDYCGPAAARWAPARQHNALSDLSRKSVQRTNLKERLRHPRASFVLRFFPVPIKVLFESEKEMLRKPSWSFCVGLLWNRRVTGIST